MLGSDINESENKEKLLEKLDEIKASLDEKHQQLHRLDHDRQRLKQYKQSLDDISYEIFEMSFAHITEALRNNDADLQLLEENRLKGRLLDFLNAFETDDSLSSGNADQQDNYAAFRVLLDNLRTEASLSTFVSAASDSCFFNDSLQIDSLQSVLCGGIMNSVKDALKDAMSREDKKIRELQFDLEEEINFLKGIKRKIQDKIKDEANIDLWSILMGLPLFCFTIVFLFIGPGWIQSRYGNGVINPLLEKSQSILLDLSTVLLLTMSVLILGLSGNINGDVLGTLIGGISGYVLNKAKV